MKQLLLAFLLAVPALTRAGNDEPKIDLNTWILQQERASIQKLLANISPAGAAKGAVVASPSKEKPNYFKHWVRDAALVMQEVFDLSKAGKISVAEMERLFMDYVDFSVTNQATQTQAGLGEPLFLADGAAFNDPWGRPQNDGPALRTLVLIEFAAHMINTGRADYVKTKLYDSKLPSASVIKNDLEYLSHHIDQSSFDVWEEVRGFNFFTMLAQHQALERGAQLAAYLGDKGAANWYIGKAASLGDFLRDGFSTPVMQKGEPRFELQAQAILKLNDRKQLNSFLNQAKSLSKLSASSNGAAADLMIRPTVLRVDGVDYKNSELDTVVILASLYLRPLDLKKRGYNFYEVLDPRISNTIQTMLLAFSESYAINQAVDFDRIFPLIGRYPEDKYNGIPEDQTAGRKGNPWILTTAGFAEYYYRVAFFLSSRIKDIEAYRAGQIPLPSWTTAQEIQNLDVAALKSTKADMISIGDAFLERIKTHGGRDGSLSEQINRDSGQMQGAENLTWSHVSVLRAFRTRASAQ